MMSNELVGRIKNATDKDTLQDVLDRSEDIHSGSRQTISQSHLRALLKYTDQDYYEKVDGAEIVRMKDFSGVIISFTHESNIIGLLEFDVAAMDEKLFGYLVFRAVGFDAMLEENADKEVLAQADAMARALVVH